MRLQGKVAIVTGGGSGFGEGIATLFAQEGARVVVADIVAAAAERVAEAHPGRRRPGRAGHGRRDPRRRHPIDDRARGRALRPPRCIGQQCRRDPRQHAADRGQRGGLRPGLRRERKSLYWAARHAVPVDAGTGRRRDRQHGLHGGPPAAPRPHLVQWQQGGGGPDHQIDGGRAARPTRSGSTPSARWPARHLCSHPSWAATRPS